MTTKMKILCLGIKQKLDRGETLEEILLTYINLTNEEKQELIGYFNQAR